MVVLPVVMAWLAEWPQKEPPDAVSELLNEAVGLFQMEGESGSRIPQRLRAALAESVPAWRPMPSAVGAGILNHCVRLARLAVTAILEKPRDTRSDRAALVAAAAAEVLRRRRSDAEAATFLDGLALKQRKHSAFIRALTFRRC